MVCSCSQVGPGADELGATWKVPRFLGYASACREGSIVGDDEVEKLNSADEAVLNKANAVRAKSARRDENHVHEVMEKFFDEYADLEGCEKVNRGERLTASEGSSDESGTDATVSYDVSAYETQNVSPK